MMRKKREKRKKKKGTRACVQVQPHLSVPRAHVTLLSMSWGPTYAGPTCQRECVEREDKKGWRGGGQLGTGCTGWMGVCSSFDLKFLKLLCFFSFKFEMPMLRWWCRLGWLDHLPAVCLGCRANGRGWGTCTYYYTDQLVLVPLQLGRKRVRVLSHPVIVVFHIATISTI